VLFLSVNGINFVQETSPPNLLVETFGKRTTMKIVARGSREMHFLKIARIMENCFWIEQTCAFF